MRAKKTIRKGGINFACVNHIYGFQEAQIVTWVAIGLKHEAIKLSKKRNRIQSKELLILDDPMLTTKQPLVSCSFAPEDDLILRDALSLLTKQQQRVIWGLLIGINECEMAEIMGISKQAVNRIKHRALTKISRNWRTAV